MSISQKDNSTFRQKTALRAEALKELGAAEPVILETHGGFGRIFARCYSQAKQGIVFETDARKTSELARQRPTWAVYEADCVMALENSVGSHLAVNFLDVDPYGEPWPVLDAFFGSDRPRASRLVLVVNDGLRQKLKMNGGWTVKSLEQVAQRYGNSELYRNYLKICRELVKEKAAMSGYKLRRWTGYYCGHGKHMSHYAAVLERGAG